ncbi:MAG: winged helix-turn-helix transcriptional regulator [Anaerolineales bacterium]|nr:winged helix-turn-helix transcriptional regulator [Anaerolineales bacterium]
MSATRNKILQTLLKKPKSTINEMAEVVGINPISVRHHLTNLQMEGLVEAQEERHGVGRPRLVYLLTSEGMEQFPTRYLQLTKRLITQMKESMPAETVSTLFGQIADNLVSQYEHDVKGLSMEARLDFVKDLLAQEGFTVEWEKKDDSYQIHETSCPYYQIGIAHPEVCTVDQTLISKMLALPVNKVQCILDGSAHCTYVVQQSNVKNK